MNRLEFIKSVGVGATAVVVAPVVAMADSPDKEAKKATTLEDKINRLYPNIIEVMENGISNGMPSAGGTIGTFHILTEILDNKAEQYWGNQPPFPHRTINTKAYSIIFRRSIKISKSANLEEEKQRERELFYRDIKEYIDKKITKDIGFREKEHKKALNK